MSAKNGKRKFSGPTSKKVQRRTRAIARQKAYDALTPEQQREKKDINRQEYKYWHDDEQHLNKF